MNKTFNTITMISILALCLMLGVTLASSNAWASKTELNPDLSDTKDTHEPATQDEIDRASTVNITTPPPHRMSKSNSEAPYFYRFRHSITMRAGIEEPLNDLGNPGAMFGFLYWFPTEDLHGVEGGAELDRDGNGILHLASRTVVGDGRLRWFYKFGAGIRIVASDQLVTFLRPRNWQARVAGGFEWSFSDPLSFRFDLEPVINTERIIVLTTFGISAAW